MDVTLAFEHTGAALDDHEHAQEHALLLVLEHDGLSAAILDHALGDGDSALLYKRLNERGIPFMIYSGFPKTEDASQDAVHISKPATHDVLVTAMEGLIQRAEAVDRKR